MQNPHFAPLYSVALSSSSRSSRGLKSSPGGGIRQGVRGSGDAPRPHAHGKHEKTPPVAEFSASTRARVAGLWGLLALTLVQSHALSRIAVYEQFCIRHFHTAPFPPIPLLRNEIRYEVQCFLPHRRAVAL